MIIYGWGHFNRRDHSLVRDTCRSCGRAGYLRSYTSSRFFTLYFIPFIPLGRHKILQECPHCKQAFGMSVRKWRKLGRTEGPRALAEYEAGPTNPEAVRGVLGACIGLQDRALLRRVGPAIRASFARDAEVLGLLGSAYSHLCLDKEADEVFLEAVALAPDGPVAAEAQAHLELQKLARPAPPNRLLQSLPVLIVPAILLFVALGLVQKAATRGLDQAYLVNGLDRPYTVVINGESVRLRANQVMTTSALARGENRIEGAEGAGFLGEEVFTVDVSFWDRLTSRTTAVINPDRSAVISWERTPYSADTQGSAALERIVHVGDLVQVHQDLDYVFSEFPSQITLSNRTGTVYRTRIANLTTMPLAALANMLVGAGSQDHLTDYVRARLRTRTDESADFVFLAARFLPREEFLAAARDKIARLPVLIEWHRAYQTMLEGTPEAQDLANTYRALVAAHPDDSTLLYLLARVLDDPSENIPLFEKAARMPQPSAYAANALAYHYIVCGDFASAVPWSAAALKIDPSSERFRAVRYSALYGLRDFETVEREAGDPSRNKDNALNAFHGHIYRMVKLGRTAEVPAEIARYVQRTKASSGLNDLEERAARAYLESAAALGEGNRARYAECAARIQMPAFQLQAALTSRDANRIRKIDAQDPDVWSSSDRLAAYVVLARAGHADEAQAHLSKAISQLQGGTGDERQWAAWLAADEPPSTEAAVLTCADFENHEVYLTALAERFATCRSQLIERATATHWNDTYATLAIAGAAP